MQKTVEPSVAPGLREVLPFGIFRHSAVKLLAALGLLIVSEPFVDRLPYGDLVESLLLSLVMVFAVLAVGGRRRTLIAALVLVAPALAGKWINHFRPDLLSPELFLISAVVFFGFVVAQLLRFIAGAARVDANVLSAGVAGFLMLGLFWIPMYLLAAKTGAGAFAVMTESGVKNTLENFDAFYLSFITLCTVGFGDVRPVSEVARMLAMMEAISGIFYMALLIARLVSVSASNEREAARSSADR